MSRRMAIARFGMALVAASVLWWAQPFPDDVALAVLIAVILGAGLLIGRWWALLIALSPTVFAATTMPTGTEDTRAGLVELTTMIWGVGELVLITLGVVAAKLAAAVWRRRRSGGACA